MLKISFAEITRFFLKLYFAILKFLNFWRSQGRVSHKQQEKIIVACKSPSNQV